VGVATDLSSESNDGEGAPDSIASDVPADAGESVDAENIDPDFEPWPEDDVPEAAPSAAVEKGAADGLEDDPDFEPWPDDDDVSPEPTQQEPPPAQAEDPQERDQETGEDEVA
jgi:hypothetical protein